MTFFDGDSIALAALPGDRQGDRLLRLHFPQGDALDASESLSRDYKLAASGPDPLITYICQYRESDHNLLHRHWEQLGWHYRYEHRRDGHTLWLSDDTTSGQPIDGELSSMPFQHQAGSLEDDGVHGWSPVRRMAPGKMTLASFNFKNPRSARTSGDSLNWQGAVPQLEVYENTGSYGFKNIDDGELLARRRMEEIDNQGQLYQAQGKDRTAQPGRWFTLSGHFDGGAGKTATECMVLNRYSAAARSSIRLRSVDDVTRRLACNMRITLP